MRAHLDPLLEKLRSHTAKVGVLGLGYVGLPLALRFAEAGLPTLGFDIDPAKVAALQRGETYMKTIVRETPAAEILKLLIERGAQVEYSDPHVPRFPRMRAHRFELESASLDANSLPTYDCVVLVTDHDAFDYELVRRHARLVVDTRGRYPAGTPNVVAA